MISLLPRFSTTRKILLIAGMITLLLSTCVVFPLEKSKTYLLEEFRYTFLTLAIALFLIMFGLMGKHFFKGLLFLMISSMISAVLFYVAYPVFPFAVFVAISLGIPSGVITALIFMIVNFYFFSGNNSHKLVKQVIVYLIILFIVSVLFGYGGDWIYEITEYFKNKN